MTASSLDRPIFIIGVARSGTTLLLNLFVKHPDLAWFSNIIDQYPQYAWLSFLSRIWDIPYFGNKIGGRISGLQHSHESINVYKYCRIHKQIYKKQRVLDEQDVEEFQAQQFRRILSKTLHYWGKPRFINKNTNNCMRIRYLNAIFPDAIFVHIIRDGRAVANSLLNVDWWPKLNLWWADYTPREWETLGNSPIRLCAIHWKREIQSILNSITHVDPKRIVSVRYEDLVQDTTNQMKFLIDKCGLSWNEFYEQQLQKVDTINQNYKWERNLSKPDRLILENSLSQILNQLGY